MVSRIMSDGLVIILLLFVCGAVIGLSIRAMRTVIQWDKKRMAKRNGTSYPISNVIERNDMERNETERVVPNATPEPDKDDLPDSLTRCPDCNGAVSWYATQCPHCGRPLKALKGDVGSPKPQQRNGTSAFGVFLAIVIAGLVLWYIAAPYTTPTWVQYIGGTIGALLKGEDTYRIVDWGK